MRDVDWLRAHVDKLSQTMERGQAEPWSIGDAPVDYIADMLNGIVGLRMEVEKLEGVWKMSQNHPKANRVGTINGLNSSEKISDGAVAEIMQGLEKARK